MLKGTAAPTGKVTTRTEGSSLLSIIAADSGGSCRERQAAKGQEDPEGQENHGNQ